MGQSRSSGSALGMRGLGSHSPTSSYDCQGQSNAEAHSPQESLLAPAWGWGWGDRGASGLGSSQGCLGSERKPPSFLASFTRPVNCLQLLTEHLLCAQQTPR